MTTSLIIREDRKYQAQKEPKTNNDIQTTTQTS